MEFRAPHTQPIFAGQNRSWTGLPPLPTAPRKKPRTEDEGVCQRNQAAEIYQSIDDLNDVVLVSGVNMREAEAELLAGPDQERTTTARDKRESNREEYERSFLERGSLRAKIESIEKKHGISISCHEEVLQCLSLAAEEHLRSMLEKSRKYFNKRRDGEKYKHSVIVTSDPQRKVRNMRAKAKKVTEKLQAEENKRLIKLDEEKNKGEPEGGGNKDLKLKAKRRHKNTEPIEHDEEAEKMRAKAANAAARAAVGGTDMLSKWEAMAAEGLAKRQGHNTTNNAEQSDLANETTGSRQQHSRPGAIDGRAHVGRQPPEQPQTLKLRDVVPVLERDLHYSKSTILEKARLRGSL